MDEEYKFPVGLNNRGLNKRKDTLSVEDAIAIYRRGDGKFRFRGWLWNAIKEHESYEAFKHHFDSIEEVIEFLDTDIETYLRDHYVEWRGGCGVQLVTDHRPPEVPVLTTRTSMEIDKGSSYYGSGCYHAGYKVLSGKVDETPIAGSDTDNGFARTKSYRIRPVGGSAIVEVWNGDAISSSSHRSLGTEGKFLLVPDGSEIPKVCPECGHILKN